jgi:uncharacterized protein (DUF1697 family)
MTVFVAFLRAVNVGGTGRLPMSDLREICNGLGFADVQTYIASGNLTFDSNESKASIKTALEGGLRDYMGKDVGVIIRTASELRTILNENPFPDRDPKFTVAIFLDRKPPKDALDMATGQVDEDMQLGAREIYVYFGSGMGRSKLKIPAARDGTARNMNTIKKMVALSST